VSLPYYHESREMNRRECGYLLFLPKAGLPLGIGKGGHEETL